jgi:hypothetical protein
MLPSGIESCENLKYLYIYMPWLMIFKGAFWINNLQQYE